MNHASLFSGIGGLDLAAHWAGMKSVIFCEREPYCQDILSRRFPGVPIIDDIREFTRERVDSYGIGKIDIISGGFPCQPFSHAGKRTGTDDDRYLWPEMRRVVDEIRPSWVFAENVDGLVSMAQSDSQIIMEDETTLCEEAEMVIETIRKDLEAIGYRSIPVVVPACGIGAMHRRYRIFIVGNAERGGRGGEPRGRSREEPENGHSELESGAVAYSGEIGLQKKGSKFQTAGVTGSCEIMADPESEQNRRREQLRIQPDVGTISQTMADPESIRDHSEGEHRDNRDRAQGNEEWREPQPRPSDDRQDVADTGGTGREECDTPTFTDQQGYDTGSHDSRRSARPIEPGLGRSPYELSDWLDGWGMNPLDALVNFIRTYPQPAPMGMEQWEWEPPRVATGVKNRVARLKALGNAVDPLQALPVLYGIRVLHEQLRG